MCSIRWLRPASGSSSAAEPVPIHSPRATERTDCIRAVTTRTPESSTVSSWPCSTASACFSANSGGRSWLATLRVAPRARAVARATRATRSAVALAVAPVAPATVAAVTAIAAVTAALGAAGGGQRGQLLDRLARDVGVLGQAQADAPALAVDLDHAHGDLVALVEHVLYGVDPLTGRHVGDVQQAVGALGQLDEGAEGRRLDDLAGEGVADLDLLGHRADALDQGVALGAGDGVDEHHALVVDVHLGLVLLLQGADGLAALADEQADLLRVDLDRADPRGVLGELLARGLDRLVHLAEDERAPLLGLLERVAHDLERDAGDLDVHLQGGDAPLGAGHLEVHVAEMVLHAGDVGQDDVVVALLDQAHG